MPPVQPGVETITVNIVALRTSDMSIKACDSFPCADSSCMPPCACDLLAMGGHYCYPSCYFDIPLHGITAATRCMRTRETHTIALSYAQSHTGYLHCSGIRSYLILSLTSLVLDSHAEHFMPQFPAGSRGDAARHCNTAASLFSSTEPLAFLPPEMAKRFS